MSTPVIADRQTAEPPAESPGRHRAGLSGLLAAAAALHGERLAFRDQANRERWSGRPPLEWTFAVAQKMVDRLAAAFVGLGLPPGSPIGVCLPNGSEAWLTSLALDRAGLMPCLLPAGWSAVELSHAVETANLQAVVTQGVLAEDRPAETLCRVAAQHFGLRFILAFGPQVPDGVIDLDRVMLTDDPDATVTPNGRGSAGRVTFSLRENPPEPVFRPADSIAASTENFLRGAAFEAGDRIITLITPDTHAGLTTGIAAALAAGATLEAHGLFDGAALRDSVLDDPFGRPGVERAGPGAIGRCGPVEIDRPDPPPAGSLRGRNLPPE